MMIQKRSFQLVLFAVIFGSVFLFSSCKKDVANNVPNVPAAGLMAFNLIPDNGAIGFALSGNSISNYPLLYNSYNGGYQAIFVGSRDVTSYNFNTAGALATTTQVFADSAYYSVFALGINGKYRNVVVKDNIGNLPSSTGQAFVRYINGIADSTIQPLVNISANGSNVINTNAPYGSVSDFKAIVPGTVSVSVANEANFTTARTITLEQGKIYTVLLSGIPNQTDSTKAVQIKFIQNGVVGTP